FPTYSITFITAQLFKVYFFSLILPVRIHRLFFTRNDDIMAFKLLTFILTENRLKTKEALYKRRSLTESLIYLWLWRCSLFITSFPCPDFAYFHFFPECRR